MIDGVQVSYGTHRQPNRSFKAPPVKITKPPLATYVIKEEESLVRPHDEDDDDELRGFDSTPLDAQVLPVKSRVNVEKECLQIEFEDEQCDLIGGAMCLFYTQSPFADSAPHPFLLDGRYHYTLEHFFQVQMLLALVDFFVDPFTVLFVVSACFAWRMKRCAFHRQSTFVAVSSRA